MTSFWSLSHVRAHAWQWFLGVGMAMSLGYFLLPSAAVQDLAYQVPGMLAVVAIFAGICLHRPHDPRPWVVLAAGLALTTAGDWTWVILDRVYGIEPFPSVADVFYLGGMGMVARGRAVAGPGPHPRRRSGQPARRPDRGGGRRHAELGLRDGADRRRRIPVPRRDRGGAGVPAARHRAAGRAGAAGAAARRAADVAAPADRGPRRLPGLRLPVRGHVADRRLRDRQHRRPGVDGGRRAVGERRPAPEHAQHRRSGGALHRRPVLCLPPAPAGRRLADGAGGAGLPVGQRRADRRPGHRRRLRRHLPAGHHAARRGGRRAAHHAGRAARRWRASWSAARSTIR